MHVYVKYNVRAQSYTVTTADVCGTLTVPNGGDNADAEALRIACLLLGSLRPAHNRHLSEVKHINVDGWTPETRTWVADFVYGPMQERNYERTWDQIPVWHQSVRFNLNP